MMTLLRAYGLSLLAMIILPTTLMANPLNILKYRDVPYITGGIGIEEREYLASIMSQFNLQLEVALKSGEYISDADVRITDSQNQVQLQVRMNGPILLAKLKPGNYTFEIHHKNQVQKRQHQLKDDKLRRFVFQWSNGQAQDVVERQDLPVLPDLPAETTTAAEKKALDELMTITPANPVAPAANNAMPPPPPAPQLGKTETAETPAPMQTPAANTANQANANADDKTTATAPAVLPGITEAPAQAEPKAPPPSNANAEKPVEVDAAASKAPEKSTAAKSEAEKTTTAPVTSTATKSEPKADNAKEPVAETAKTDGGKKVPSAPAVSETFTPPAIGTEAKTDKVTETVTEDSASQKPKTEAAKSTEKTETEAAKSTEKTEAEAKKKEPTLPPYWETLELPEEKASTQAKDKATTAQPETEKTPTEAIPEKKPAITDKKEEKAVETPAQTPEKSEDQSDDKEKTVQPNVIRI